MTESLKFFLNDLEKGATKKFCGAYSPEFMELEESELSFSKDIELNVTAYLADQDLVLNVNAAAWAQMPCRICNQEAEVLISVNNHYHTQPKSEIKNGVVHVGKDVVRELILLGVPHFAECEGSCPQREGLKPYSREQKVREEEAYRPFANLSLD